MLNLGMLHLNRDWGSGSIRANLYGSVLCAMFSWLVLRIRREGTRIEMKYGRDSDSMADRRRLF